MRDLTMNIYTISRCTHSFYARELRRLSLTMGQFPFIMGIVENDGISQERLSNQLRISKSTTATVMQQLLRAGLITRETDPDDRRNFRLHATDRALALVPKIREIIDRCHRLITADLTDLERDLFWQLAEKVRDEAEQIGRRQPDAKR